MDLIRGAWRRAGKRATATPLYIVHRIDKDTSGLLCFAKTRLAERGAARGLPAPHRRAAPTWPSPRATSARRASNRTWSPIAATASAARRRHHRTRASTPSRYVRAACAGLRDGDAVPRAPGDRPHAPDPHPPRRTRPPAGRRDGLHPRPLARRPHSRCPRPACMLHAATLGFPHPVTGEPLELRARAAAPTSWPCSNRWEARVRLTV